MFPLLDTLIFAFWLRHTTRAPLAKRKNAKRKW